MFTSPLFIGLSRPYKQLDWLAPRIHSDSLGTDSTHPLSDDLHHILVHKRSQAAWVMRCYYHISSDDPMDGFSVQTILSTADWHAYRKAWGRRISTDHGHQKWELGKIMLVALGGAGIALTFRALGRPFHIAEFLAGC